VDSENPAIRKIDTRYRNDAFGQRVELTAEPFDENVLL